mmetsp:Transcript_3075/g.6236  ORF Transcript_3075/g.6236 Transcript_3075/m.6236 type:complete len:84 (+) Transcript_3075:777-1028(+)
MVYLLHQSIESSSKRMQGGIAWPFFFNPCPKARIKPIEPCIQKSGRPSMYKDISWSEFRNRRFKGDYADEGKEVQISDYLHHE